MKEKKLVLEQFEELYGGHGQIRLFFAPGRVNLIGEHTDYNGGHVFPCALGYGTYAAVRERQDRKVRLFSLNMPKEIIECDLDHLMPETDLGWEAYPQGVIWAYEKWGYSLPQGIDIAYAGNIPAGSGLSSSAAIEVVTAIAIKNLFNLEDVGLVKIAQLCQYAENHYNGLSCGIMDQFTSALGKKDTAIFLDTNTLDFDYVKLPLKDEKLVIVNSMVKHSLVSSAYNERQSECKRALCDLQEIMGINELCDLSPKLFDTYQSAIKDDICRKRARHVVHENARTLKAVDALVEGDLETFGKLMNESHVSMRDDYEVSCEEMDFLARLGWETPGVLGSRMTGGGFGGCTVSLVKEEAVEAFTQKVTGEYQKKFGIRPKVYVAEIGDGAREIAIES
ncbi:galactokinase [Eubacterium oxidoreducens]|nr:galactokinase [Eubacterium oxidoreducens]